MTAASTDLPHASLTAGSIARIRDNLGIRAVGARPSEHSQLPL
jgi:hypothetical protein